jgi:hypothetical protein
MKNSTIIILIFSILFLFSCQSEHDKSLKKIESYFNSKDSKMMFELTIDFIDKYPEDVTSIQYLIENTLDSSLHLKLSERVLEKKLNAVLQINSLNYLLDYYTVFSSEVSNNNLNSEKLRIANIFFDKVIKDYSINFPNEAKLAKVQLDKNNEYLKKIEKLFGVIQIASGLYDKGNSFVGSLYGRANAYLTSIDLSITYDVFNPYSRNSDQQYQEKGSLSSLNFETDNTNIGYNLLKGTWNVPNKNADYAVFYIKLEDVLKSKRILLIIKGAANFQYQCYKDLNDASWEKFKNKLELSAFDNKSEISLLSKKEISDADSLAELSYKLNKIFCIEKEPKRDNDPISKISAYKKYVAYKKGSPDDKGRYFYEYFILKKNENGSYAQIKNASLFNKDSNKLLSIINSKLEKIFIDGSKNSEDKDCFDDKTFKPFTFDQLGITFDQDKIEFNASFGLSFACLAVDGNTISFNLTEIKRYLDL